ncbi:MAG: hypothetical protein ABSH04_04850, partial [Acidimicrobiales bacterium]
MPAGILVLQFNVMSRRADEERMDQTEPVGLVANEAAPEYVDLERYTVDLSAAPLLPETVARRYHVVPLGRRFGAPVVAISDPTDLVALDELRVMIGREFVPVVASREQIDIYLSRLYPDSPFDPTLATSGLSIQTSRGLATDVESSNGRPSAGASSVGSEPTLDVPQDPLGSQLEDETSTASGVLPVSEPSAWQPGQVPDDGVVPVADLTAEAAAELEQAMGVVDSGEGESGGDQGQPGLAQGELARFPPLARVLVEGGRVPQEIMREVVAEHDRTGQAIAGILTARNLVMEADLMWGMAQEMGLDFVDLDVYGVDFVAAFQLPEATARHHHVLVIGDADGLPVVAASNPPDVFAMDDVRTILGRNFVTMVATQSQISAYIDRAYHQGSDASELATTAAASSDQSEYPDDAINSVQAVVDDAPIVRYVN